MSANAVIVRNHSVDIFGNETIVKLEIANQIILKNHLFVAPKSPRLRGRSGEIINDRICPFLAVLIVNVVTQFYTWYKMIVSFVLVYG